MGVLERAHVQARQIIGEWRTVFTRAERGTRMSGAWSSNRLSARTRTTRSIIGPINRVVHVHTEISLRKLSVWVGGPLSAERGGGRGGGEWKAGPDA